ncbi:endo alpha-1,4 polygalactosaminidase [Blastococcus sp. SYSU D00695]
MRRRGLRRTGAETPAGLLLLLRDGTGMPLEDPGRPGEFLFDVSTPAQRDAVLALVGPWVDGCAADGFDAIELDDLDSWTRSGGRLDAAPGTPGYVAEDCPAR